MLMLKWEFMHKCDVHVCVYTYIYIDTHTVFKITVKLIMIVVSVDEP